MDFRGIVVLAFASLVVWQFYLRTKEMGADRPPEEWDKEYDQWLANFKVFRPKRKPFDLETTIKKLHRAKQTVLWLNVVLMLVLAIGWIALVRVLRSAHAPSFTFIIATMALLIGIIVLASSSQAWKKRISVFEKIAINHHKSETPENQK